MWLVFVGVAVFIIVVYLVSPSAKNRRYHSIKHWFVLYSLFKQRKEEERLRVIEREKRRRWSG